MHENNALHRKTWTASNIVVTCSGLKMLAVSDIAFVSGGCSRQARKPINA
jgi:hypothetical protein